MSAAATGDTTCNTAATDAAYLASQALADLATVIGRDLLPVPIGIAPPAHGFELEVHVRNEDMPAWVGSLVHRTAMHPRRSRSAIHWQVIGTLDGTDTRIELCWIQDPS